MISKLSIKNYKSVKDINLSPKRVNIFIGELNSGKSNILEALSWFSTNAFNKDTFNQLFRFKNIGNFFYDFDATQTIEVATDELILKIRYARNSNGALLNYFEGIIYRFGDTISENDWINDTKKALYFNLDVSTNEIKTFGTINTSFRAYIFKRLQSFKLDYIPYLNTPFGENIPTIINSNKEYKQLISDFFKSKGFRLIIKPHENEIEMAKDTNNELYSYAYPTISETMQRFVFLLLAIETNTNATIILDELESNMFPFFVKDFAERIADNEKNQFFISTHNPYLLGSLLEKTKLDEVSVFITRMENYKTTVTLCNGKQINELISFGSGSFFNLENILE